MGTGLQAPAATPALSPYSWGPTGVGQPPQPQSEPSRSERPHTPVANLPAMPTPSEGQWPAAGLADPSDPSQPPPLTAAVAFRAAGTMAGSGADMLLPHIHRLDLLSTTEAKGRTGTRPRPRGLRAAAIPGPPHRARAQARARQRRANLRGLRAPSSVGPLVSPLPRRCPLSARHNVRLLCPPDWL